MGGFLVKYRDINSIMWEYKEKLTELMDNIAVVKRSVEEFTQLENFKGEAAESIKSYMEDVHITLLSNLEVAAQNLLDNMILYKRLYYDIDDSTNFVLSEEDIEQFRSTLSDRCLDTDCQGDVVNSAIWEISDLITLTVPDVHKDMVADAHERTDKKLMDLLDSIREHERTTVERVEQSAEALISELRNCIKKTSTNHIDINNYEKNSYYTDLDIYRLSYLSQAIYRQHEYNKEIYDAIWTAEEEIKEQADARNTEGIWEMIGGAILVVGGTLCIVATAGAATPIVVAGAAAGGGTAIFGMYDFGEGVQDAYYGSTGDIDSIAVNNLKDDLFMGNEEYYYMAEECISFAASALVPIGAAGKAGELTFRSGAKTVGKMTVSSLAGKGASELTMELTDNRTLSMMAGMAADMTTGFGLEAVDARHSVSMGSKSGTDIIDNSNMMLRKAKDISYIEPMPKKQLQRIVKAFKKQGGIIQMDDATDAYLTSKNAEAITLNENTILLRQKPGRASVFEELIHATQFRQGLNDGSVINRIQNEIAAQEMLLRNSKAYKLTPAEIKQTQSALASYISELQKLTGGN